jgi:hypothetical protein
MAPNMKQLIIKAFMSVTSTDNTSQFTNQWICDEGWFQILTHHIPSLKDALNINRANVIRSISSVAVPLKSEGEILIYHKIFQNNTANNHRGTTDTVDLTATAQSTIIQSNKVNITAIKMTKHDG